MTKRILGIVLVASLGLASNVRAGQPRTHDGLFLRMSGGFGFANTSTTDAAGDEFDLGDIGGDLNFAIGGMIGNNLALHGTLWGWSVDGPDLEINDEEFNTNGNVSLGALGGGLTYYWEPTNLYVSGSLGLGRLSFNSDLEQLFSEDNTDFGLAVDACVGKEWWVGNSWGLGVAGDVNFHSFPEDGIDDNWSGVSFGLRFSATLN